MTRVCRFNPLVMALGLVIFAVFSIVHAQVRGVYPLGMSAINSGVTPGPGFTYSNFFAIYSRSQFKGPNGEILATGNQSVIMDMNSFIWVSKREILGGAKFSMSATLPIAKNSLVSDITGPGSGGKGFADSYYQPFILGWQKERAAVRAVYGFLAPTGRFNAGASDNVGSGYWTHVMASGQTFYLTKNKAYSVSAFQMYEFHTPQKQTKIHPGQNLDMDYSFMRAIRFGGNKGLQLGLVGYNSWQTSAKTGPTITPEQSRDRYVVNGLGLGSNFNLPRKINLGFKYFREFSNRSTFQGYSAQLSGSISF